jgi:hypothetical protein
MSKLSPETIKAVHGAGFDLYMSEDPRWASYGFFTDGTRIGYIQEGGFEGVTLSTVHVPNRQTGTGFGMGSSEGCDRAALETAFCNAPGWASNTDRASVTKYANFEAFLAARPSFSGKLVKVEKEA